MTLSKYTSKHDAHKCIVKTNVSIKNHNQRLQKSNQNPTEIRLPSKLS